MTRFLLMSTLLCLNLTACLQTGPIGTQLDLCCPGNYASYQRYRLDVIDMPVFLSEYVVSEFEQVVVEKGLSRDDDDYQLRIVLAYNHINLEPEQQAIDPFARVESLTTQLHYIAEIQMRFFEVSSNDLVWAGAIRRVHRVSPGQYMHENRSRPAFRQAFRQILATYPTLSLASP